MEPDFITATLRMQFGSVSRFAELKGFRQSNVSAVIHGRRKTRSIRRAIAKALDMNTGEVFVPSRQITLTRVICLDAIYAKK